MVVSRDRYSEGKADGPREPVRAWGREDFRGAVPGGQRKDPRQQLANGVASLGRRSCTCKGPVASRGEDGAFQEKQPVWPEQERAPWGHGGVCGQGDASGRRHRTGTAAPGPPGPAWLRAVERPPHREARHIKPPGETRGTAIAQRVSRTSGVTTLTAAPHFRGPPYRNRGRAVQANDSSADFKNDHEVYAAAEE